MHYYLAKSRAEGEKEKLNGVLAHQAAFPFLLLCGDSRKGRKIFKNKINNFSKLP